MGKVTRQPVTIDGETGRVSDMPVVTSSNPLASLISKESALVLGLGLIAGYFAGQANILQSIFDADGEDDDG